MELCTYVGSRRRGQLFTAEDQRRYGSMSPCGSEQVSEFLLLSEQGVFFSWWNDAARELAHQVHLDLWGRRAQAVCFVHDDVFFRQSE